MSSHPGRDSQLNHVTSLAHINIEHAVHQQLLALCMGERRTVIHDSFIEGALVESERLKSSLVLSTHSWNYCQLLWFQPFSLAFYYVLHVHISKVCVYTLTSRQRFCEGNRLSLQRFDLAVISKGQSPTNHGIENDTPM